MKTLKSCIILLPFFFMSSTLFGQHVGFVNSKAVLSGMPEIEAVQSNLKALKSQLEKTIEESVTDLTKRFEDFQKRDQQGLLAPKEREQEALALQEDERKIVVSQQEMQAQLIERENELLEPVIQRFRESVSRIAKEKKFNCIMDLSSGNMVYYETDSDITELVLTELQSSRD